MHTNVWRADVGSMKGASSNVETVLSGVKRLLGDFAATMSPEVLFLYVFIHYNMQYEFMMPTVDEVVKLYLEYYGPEAQAEDLAGEDSGSECEGEGEGEEQEGEEGGDQS